MKATHTVPAALQPNEALFKDPFFTRFELKPSPQPLQLTDEITKHYKFPTFYRDVTCAMGVFLCDYDKAQRLLPHPKMNPVRMTKGRAVVAFSCYEYKQVMGVAPYNEIAMTIPVLFDAPYSLPVLPMIAGGAFPGFGYYVFGMPVTSKENQLRGNRIWGLPKLTEDIDTREEGGDFITTAYDEQGKSYFELKVPMQGKPTHFDVKADLFSKRDGKFWASPTCFEADFNVVKHMGQLFKKGNAPDRTYLTIDASSQYPMARTLRELEIEPHPFQFRFARPMNAAFDLPRKEVRV